MRLRYGLLGATMLGVFGACSGDGDPGQSVLNGGNAGSGAGGTSAGTSGDGGTGTGGLGGEFVYVGCEPKTCEALGWACGYHVDECGNVTDCSLEGRVCAADQVCVGGIDGPTECVSGGTGSCEVCDAIPDCGSAVQPTRLTGRVVSPGRTDDDTGNQVGVPNAIVYILRTNEVSDLPAISSGIPSGGTSCDRCEDQDLGPVLTGAVTDAAGNYVLEGNIPIGEEFLLVVKAGKFRRAVRHTLAAEAACATTELPTAVAENLTRLPRSMDDGLAVNIPRVAVSTGQIDAMECVFEKMGIAHTEFANPGGDASAAPRIHVYRGGPDDDASGARIDDQTPHDSELYSDLERLQSYDMVVADCEGQDWDGDFDERDAFGDNVREYVNRGGRLFTSHLSFSWLHENGDQAYSDAAPIETGLAAAGEWATNFNLSDTGEGHVSINRDQASPRIEQFAAWMVNEGITTAPEHTFTIVEPRSQNTALGPASEEFVHQLDGTERVQQFSFNTPYAAPAEAACGRVAYSGFHVSVGGGSSPFADAVFPNHCDGDLTDQEKVLLYMLFDLGACVGEPPLPPACEPASCRDMGARCGVMPDGCGGVLDCGACRPPA